MDDARLEALEISVISIQSVRAHDAAIFVVYLLDNLVLQLLCEQCICVPGLDLIN